MKRVAWILTGALTAAAIFALAFPRTPTGGRPLSQTPAAPVGSAAAPSSGAPAAAAPTVISELLDTPAGGTSGGSENDGGRDGGRSRGPGIPPNSCPGAATCRSFDLSSLRWSGDVHFRINVDNQPWMDAAAVEDAVRAAAQTWMQADPAVKFVYDGRTNSLPITDNVNVVAFLVQGVADTGGEDDDGDGQGMEGDIAVSTVRNNNDNSIDEADTAINVAFPWDWHACENRANSCTDRDVSGEPVRPYDLQAVMTHEFGLWLGLNDLDDEASRELTMYDQFETGERHQSTLGMGDMLGVRKAYPCSGCDDPVVHVP